MTNGGDLPVTGDLDPNNDIVLTEEETEMELNEIVELLEYIPEDNQDEFIDEIGTYGKPKENFRFTTINQFGSGSGYEVMKRIVAANYPDIDRVVSQLNGKDKHCCCLLAVAAVMCLLFK